jgi:hypothetical protein
MPARRSTVPTILVGAGAALYAAKTAFVSTTVTDRGNRVAMRGFKEDFDAWRGTLTDDEKALMKKQVLGEYNKKFRKSDDFKAKIPEEKVEEFSKVIGKFFEAEKDDYMKEVAAKGPDPEGITFKGRDQTLDFSLKKMVVEVDRDAMRRYHFHTQKERDRARRGEPGLPDSSPRMETWLLQNNDTKSHDGWTQAIAKLKGKDAKIDKMLDNINVPAVGEQFPLRVSSVIMDQMTDFDKRTAMALSMIAKESGEDAAAEAARKVPELYAMTLKAMIKAWTEAYDEVTKEVDAMKGFYSGVKEWEGKTKADVYKAAWAQAGKLMGKELAPLEDDVVASLAKLPAIDPEEETARLWGTASTLYKSEAIDAFGTKYLLGVFATQEEASKAFDEWNVEYEKARADNLKEMEQWGKQEQARLDADTEGQESMKRVLASSSTPVNFGK